MIKKRNHWDSKMIAELKAEIKRLKEEPKKKWVAIWDGEDGIGDIQIFSDEAEAKQFAEDKGYDVYEVTEGGNSKLKFVY